MSHVIQHIPEQQKFILSVEGKEAGFIHYLSDNNTWDITHTVVDPAFRGQGLARILVDAVIEYTEQNHIRLIAHCDYAEVILQRHRASKK
ncbi:GNAT family N-acetyltransferase [Neisseria montereyensis]|uniref:N-acetyltransferase n=1 Tax=Neisseria montereyensis TaxID=2973938 RepID=A0ABT2F924_9NEIS|nr:GNAT family N-acetyltransferase [Neisseria montereyensis]MCS4532699.1 N-acetyltransferase [Neisseria montereyensis]